MFLYVFLIVLCWCSTLSSCLVTTPPAVEPVLRIPIEQAWYRDPESSASAIHIPLLRLASSNSSDPLFLNSEHIFDLFSDAIERSDPLVPQMTTSMRLTPGNLTLFSLLKRVDETQLSHPELKAKWISIWTAYPPVWIYLKRIRNRKVRTKSHARAVLDFEVLTTALAVADVHAVVPFVEARDSSGRSTLDLLRAIPSRQFSGTSASRKDLIQAWKFYVGLLPRIDSIVASFGGVGDTLTPQPKQRGNVKDIILSTH